jgi:hypothetical protein
VGLVSQPGNEPVHREEQFSTYSWYAEDLDGMRNFVDGLYAVGAIGHERVVARDWRVKVNVASDDLLPKPGEYPKVVRYTEWQRIRQTITMLKIAVAVLCVVCVVCICLVIWLVIR